MFSWQNQPKPIIGLSPMDGITDVAFRQIHALYGKPDIMFTEFTTVEGIILSPNHTIFTDLAFEEEQRPIIAQIFGSKPDYFYKAAIICCEMGFDGIDINMGCPAKNITHHGGGAALIAKPDQAKQIIKATQKGVIDWSNGKTPKDCQIPEEKINTINKIKKTSRNPNRMPIPVSIKTRIGIEKSIVEEWIKTLLETEPANISLHGRTLKQMYTGQANWDEIAKAAKIVKQTKTTFLGNGDILTREDALKKITHYNLDGVLIGRATIGNPYIWKNQTLTPQEKIKIAIKHAKLHAQYKQSHAFIQMRKHFAHYITNFPYANEIKIQLCKTTEVNQAINILNNALKTIESQIEH